MYVCVFQDLCAIKMDFCFHIFMKKKRNISANNIFDYWWKFREIVRLFQKHQFRLTFSIVWRKVLLPKILQLSELLGFANLRSTGKSLPDQIKCVCVCFFFSKEITLFQFSQNTIISPINQPTNQPNNNYNHFV